MIRTYIYAAAGVVLLAVLAWGLRVDHLREGWKNRYETLVEEAGAVLAATRVASDNDKLEWDGTAGQIVVLGEDYREAKAAIAEQNRAIDDMAREAVRLRKKADELQAIASRAEAQRRAALRRLSDMTITPGTREDCMTLLREAEDALDLVREAGL